MNKIEPELKSKLVALSLKGKWLSVAREYLLSCWDGCTEEDYFANVTPLMPLHVNQFRQLPDPKMSAAKAALGRVGVQLEDGLWMAAAGAKRIKDEEQATEEDEQVSEEIMGYKVHPAASLFPLLEGEEFEELYLSILQHGLRQPIVVDGKVLIDGRNRLRAVEALRAKGEKVELRIAQWVDDGRNVADWIYDTNAVRRHLSEDAHAMVSAAIYPLIAKENEARREASKFKKGQSGNPNGKKQAESKSSPPARRDTKAKDARSTAGQVAARAKVSLHKAKQAVKLDKAVEAGIVSPEVKQEVISGKRKLSDAAKAIPAKKAKPEAEPKVKPFDIEKAGHRLRDLLRAELDKWPKESQRKAGYWIRQITEKEYGLEESLPPDRIPEKINLLATEFIEAAPERADELCGLLTIWAERFSNQGKQES